ncbi:MAG: sporulation initiation factor Spo0A C-terminal domain-containing protein [Clostridia bacterium]
MEKTVYAYLLSLGINPINLGIKYIMELIISELRGENILPLTLVGYKNLAQKYNKSVYCIEKNIQNVISKAWLKGDIDFLYKEFGETIDDYKGKPTNKQFIFTVAEKLSGII